MKIKLFFAAVIVAFSIDVASTMQSNALKILLAPHQVPAPLPISTLKLLDSTQQALFLFSSNPTRPSSGIDYETVVSSVPFEQTGGSPSNLFTIRQLLPSPPSWDVAVDSQRLFSLTYDDASGATYSVLVRSPAGKEFSLVAKNQFESFVSPSFVKRDLDVPAQFLTAIGEKDRGVLFRRDASGNYLERSKLCDCAALKLLKRSDGFALLYKSVVPGPVRGVSTLPGRLFVAILDRELRTVSSPKELFPGRTIFEFDADTTPERVAIFATSSTGTFLASGPSFSAPFNTRLVQEQNQGASFSQPTVLLKGSRVCLGVLEGSSPGKTSVLAASVPLDGSL
jgi:hypothetical protein